MKVRQRYINIHFIIFVYILESDNLASLKSNDFSSKKSSLGGSGWQPDLKKSPRTSFLNNDSNSSERFNEKPKNQTFNQQKSVTGEKPMDINKSKRSEDLFSKSPRGLILYLYLFNFI